MCYGQQKERQTLVQALQSRNSQEKPDLEKIESAMMSMISMDCWDEFDEQSNESKFLTFRNTLTVTNKEKVQGQGKKVSVFQKRKEKVSSNLSAQVGTIKKNPAIIVKRLNFSPVLKRGTAGAQVEELNRTNDSILSSSIVDIPINGGKFQEIKKVKKFTQEEQCLLFNEQIPTKTIIKLKQNGSQSTVKLNSAQNEEDSVISLSSLLK